VLNRNSGVFKGGGAGGGSGRGPLLTVSEFVQYVAFSCIKRVNDFILCICEKYVRWS